MRLKKSKWNYEHYLRGLNEFKNAYSLVEKYNNIHYFLVKSYVIL